MLSDLAFLRLQTTAEPSSAVSSAGCWSRLPWSVPSSAQKLGDLHILSASISVLLVTLVKYGVPAELVLRAARSGQELALDLQSLTSLSVCLRNVTSFVEASGERAFSVAAKKLDSGSDAPVALAHVQRTEDSETAARDRHALYLMVTEDGRRVDLELDATTYAPAYGAWFVQSCSHVWKQLEQTPGVSLQTVAVQDDDQCQKLLQLAHLEPDYQNETSSVLYIERQAARSPDRCAVVYRGQMQTYAELVATAERVATRLESVRQSAGGGMAGVAVLLAPGLLVPAIFLGILKAGCVYIPMEIGTPPDRLRYFLEDAPIRAVIAERATWEALGVTAGADVQILEPAELLTHTAPAALPAIKAEDPAYIIYTSGSTGRPKGVVVSHGTLSNHMLGWLQTVPAVGGSAFAGVLASSLGFDVSLWELLYVLWQGGTLHVLEPRVTKDPVEMAAYLAERRVNTACIRPAILDGVAGEFERSGRAFPLMQLFSGAESVSASVCKRFKQLNPQLDIVVGYGATETSIGATFAHYQQADGFLDIPIGRPLPGYHMYLVNSEDQLVPLGVVGEIALGGDVLATEYFGRPELTAQKFTRDPYRAAAGARWYKTGDLGRMLPDGRFLFCGRADRQVKIRGVRVELGEVEAVLREVSGASAAAVIADGEGGGRRLLAYLESPLISKDEIKQRVDALLPQVMRPAAIMVLDKLPINASMKVDRARLPVPSYEDVQTSSYEAPADALEAAIAKTASSLLRVDRLGMTDDIFEAGFNSLLVLTLLDRLRNELRAPLSLDELRDTKTLRGIADNVKKTQVSAQA